MKRFVLVGTALALMLAAVTVQLSRADGTRSDVLTDVSGLALGEPTSDDSKPMGYASRGDVEVLVGLVGDPLSVRHGRSFKKVGGVLSAAEQKAYLRDLK